MIEDVTGIEVLVGRFSSTDSYGKKPEVVTGTITSFNVMGIELFAFMAAVA